MGIENLAPVTARRISREVGWEICDTYGFEVLGFDKPAVPVALSIRNAIIDHFDEVLQLYTSAYSGDADQTAYEMALTIRFLERKLNFDFAA